MTNLTDKQKIKLFDELFKIASDLESCISCQPCVDGFEIELDAWQNFIEKNGLDG